MSLKYSHKILLMLFVTFLVMNPISFNMNIALVGKNGKLFVALLGIIIFRKSLAHINKFLIKNIWLILFWVLCLVFSIFRIWKKGFDVDLIQINILFIVFIYFFYLLASEYRIRYRRSNLYFFKHLAQAININLIFWTAIAFLFSVSFWSSVEDRTGLSLFYDSYIQLGMFACIGAISNFYMIRYKKVKHRIVYFIMFVLYAVCIYLSNSRNAQLIIFVFLLFNILPFLKRITLKYIFILTISLSIVSIFYFSADILENESLIEFSSGRSSIWYYIYEYYTDNSIFLGEGIFGLNSTILENNMDFNYYFQGIDFLYFHSSYIEVFCASGILGFIFFMIFIVKSLKSKAKFYTAIIIISLLVGGLSESFLVQPSMLMSFLFWYLTVQEINLKISKRFVNE